MLLSVDSGFGWIPAESDHTYIVCTYAKVSSALTIHLRQDLKPQVSALCPDIKKGLLSEKPFLTLVGTAGFEPATT